MSRQERSSNLQSRMGKPGLKQKVAHKIGEFLSVFLFLAPWFLAFSTYRLLLLRRFSDEPFEYGTGLVNALILAKVIATGEFLRLGTRFENRPLIFSIVWKSFVFVLLAAIFSVVEHTVRGLLRGDGITASFSSIDGAEILGRSLVMFFAFIPFFALREASRVLGRQKVEKLFLQPQNIGSIPGV